MIFVRVILLLIAFNVQYGQSLFSLNQVDYENSVKYTLYTRTQPDGVIVTAQNLTNSSFVISKKTKCITHGWRSSGTEESNILTKNNYLNVSDLNVIVMDWSAIADNIIYSTPMNDTYIVGVVYSQFLNYMINLGVDPNNIHLIGHSLGAHVSGFAGRNAIANISRITGLDPALPGFSGIQLVEGGRLTKTDALFVDIIHTCMGILGIVEAIGDVDFYPNGGVSPQPGCGLLNVFSCSHDRSWLLFANSIIKTPPYWAKNCPSYGSYLLNINCQSGQEQLGEYVSVNASGSYYLKTNDASAI